MIRKLSVVLAVVCLSFAGCTQEQPAAPPAAKPEAKPAVQPAAPAPSAAVAPATPPAPTPPEAAPPVAKTPPAAPSAPPPAPVKAPEPAVAAQAPEAAKPAPAPAAPKAIDVTETVTLAASQGQVTLPHLVHAKLFPCATCHGNGTPGKIGLTKDTAHELCRECHKAKGKGPTACGGCHKK